MSRAVRRMQVLAGVTVALTLAPSALAHAADSEQLLVKFGAGASAPGFSGRGTLPPDRSVEKGPRGPADPIRSTACATRSSGVMPE